MDVGAICKALCGVVVPMPSLLLVLSQYKLALELRVFAAVQKATRVATPLPSNPVVANLTQLGEDDVPAL